MAPLTIAQVTPYTWESGHEINRMVARVSDELADRGHRVLVVAPSGDHAAVRATRAAIRAAREKPGALFTDGAPRVLAVGEGLPAGSRRAALPIDVSRTVDALHAGVALDLCHVHDPFAPTVAAAALRASRSLNVGTFHQPTERILSTQVARKLVERIFGRLDARTTPYQTTARLMERWFPGEYRVIAPGATPVERPARDPSGPLRIAFVDLEERQALRTFLRGLRTLGLDLPWEATVLTARGASSSTPLRADVRARVRFVTPDELDEGTLLASSDVLVAASTGDAPTPDLLLRARAAGAIPVASRLPVYEEVLGDGTAGLLFEPRDTETLAAQLARVAADAELRTRLAGAPPPRTPGEVVDELEDVYAQLLARRHDGRGDPALRARLRRRRLIDVDLHMHTDHSGDCATPVEVLLDTARRQGLGAIAVTDHNEISGALEAQAKAARFGVKVIVGEEVKTASQGEVIGLFLQEKIPRGLTLEETVAEIKRQGGLVYVPHPFDRMHAVPDYENLLAIIDDIDAMEVFNPRVAIGAFNEEAERFAAKYGIVAGAGSDSHVAQGLGSVRIRMRDFDGPQEFLESLRDADIVRRPTSLLYVQALKFLETKATPPGARAARKARRVARATRKS
ncbi:MAG TPA: PHP domain-containing protein [Capillimicrobium sp.]|nr:PHP domain-containing protein [Capillimicrobium sp.]